MISASAIAMAERFTRRTRLAAAVLQALIEAEQPVVSAYGIFQILRRIIDLPEIRRYTRNSASDKATLRRVISNLTLSRAIAHDDDYPGRSLYRILDLPSGAADDVVCLASPFGYISHLSAMQAWALTDRRPAALQLTMPSPALAQDLAARRMGQDYGQAFEKLPQDKAVKLPVIRHPAMVRGRPVSVFETASPGEWVQLRSSWQRMATMGQTFLDTLVHPQLCGGMAHVLDAWRVYAEIHLDDIIERVDAAGSAIAKVRAGYIIDEMLRMGQDSRVQAWVRHAQRGGSRVLDPSKPFSPGYSEKWMLSLNV